MRNPVSQLTGMLRVLVSMNARAGRLVLFLSLSLVIAWGWRDGSRLTTGVFAQAPARDSAPDLAWIGPPGPWLVDRLAASPDGRVIVARRSVHLADREELVRTGDGGATWERIPFPAGYDDVPNRHMARLRLEIRPHGDELLLLLSMGRKERHQVIRSTDLGTTWQTVATMTTSEFEQPELVLSPTFEADGIALLVTERQLWRTTDAGRTWAVAAEPADRLIRQAAFSPVFAEDHRALLLLSPTGIYSESPPATAPTVLMSADSGASWGPLPTDPLPADVARPVVSGVWFEPPTGAAGGLPPSLLALVGNQPTQRAETSRLLRSSDGGATWNMIAPVPLRPHWDLAPLAFSPRYAQDGVTVVGEAHTCQMARTADGGASWQPVTVTVPGASGNLRCNSLRHLTHDGTAFLAGFEVESDTTAFNSRWLRSADGGATWGLLAPGGADVWIMTPMPATVGALLGTTAGIWAIGGAAAATGPADAQIACQEPVDGAISTVWMGQPEARRGLGCPLDPAQPAWIRELRDQPGGVTSYWIDGTDRSWYVLRDDGRWQSRSKREAPWPGRADDALAGATQRFEGGVMLVLPGADGTVDVLAVTDVGQQWWRYAGLTPEPSTP